MYNKLFESDIDIKHLTSPGKTASGLRRSASKHHEYAGYEFESHSRFFFLANIFAQFSRFAWMVLSLCLKQSQLLETIIMK